MAFLMSMVIVATTTGVQAGHALHAYSLAMPVALLCIHRQIYRYASLFKPGRGSPGFTK